MYDETRLEIAIQSFSQLIQAMTASFGAPPPSSLTQLAVDSAKLTIPLLQQAQALAEEVSNAYQDLSEDYDDLYLDYQDLLSRVETLESQIHTHEGGV